MSVEAGGAPERRIVSIDVTFLVHQALAASLERRHPESPSAASEAGPPHEDPRSHRRP